MSDIVIRVENLGKKYTIGHQSQRGHYTSLRDVVMQNVRDLWHKTRDLAQGKPVIQGSTLEDVWALHDVNFEIRQGDAVGIIGRNGAGKSTLLKILSRITEPTVGRVTIRGRVASLLEVGTGFHPELTGRENIFLNGAILGMTRQEIKRKFDEIVEFSGVERYLDTPVKRYSSGMYVRLAFAVAAHLEPEILVVDEVLAVGDAAFQKKCLGKMNDVVGEGRTVLFVSHSMAAVQQMCQRGIVLDQGKTEFLGNIQDSIKVYMQNISSVVATDLSARRDRTGSQTLTFHRVTIHDAEGNEIRDIMSGQDIRLRFHYRSERTYSAATVAVSFSVTSPQGYLLATFNSLDSGQSELDVYSSGFFECAWPKFNLKSASYTCALFCSIDGEIVDWIQNAFSLEVENGDFFGSGKLLGREHGEVVIDHSWASKVSDDHDAAKLDSVAFASHPLAE